MTILARRTFGAWAVSLELKWADLWVGAFWRNDKRNARFDVWVCIIPCLPIHVSYEPGIFG